MKLSEMNGWSVIESLINETHVEHGQSFKVCDCNRRVAGMKSLQHMLTESQGPQTGIYFWIPVAKGWRLEVFFDSQFPSRPGFDLDHSTIWRKWASTMLRTDDPDATKEISHNYSGLPRGRVTFFKARRRPGGPMVKKYLVLHGNDAPMKNAGKLIAGRFNLPDGLWVWEYDDHERMTADDVRAVQRYLGRDLGLLDKAAKFN